MKGEVNRGESRDGPRGEGAGGPEMAGVAPKMALEEGALVVPDYIPHSRDGKTYGAPPAPSPPY